MTKGLAAVIDREPDLFLDAFDVLHRLPQKAYPDAIWPWLEAHGIPVEDWGLVERCDIHNLDVQVVVVHVWERDDSTPANVKIANGEPVVRHVPVVARWPFPFTSKDGDRA